MRIGKLPSTLLVFFTFSAACALDQGPTHPSEEPPLEETPLPQQATSKLEAQIEERARSFLAQRRAGRSMPPIAEMTGDRCHAEGTFCVICEAPPWLPTCTVTVCDGPLVGVVGIQGC